MKDGNKSPDAFGPELKRLATHRFLIILLDTVIPFCLGVVLGGIFLVLFCLIAHIDAFGDTRVDAVVRQSEFDEAVEEIYSNVETVAESAALETLDREIGRFTDEIRTNAAEIAASAAKDSCTNEFARIESGIYTNAANAAESAAQGAISGFEQSVNAALDGKADKSALSNAVETLRGEIAASVPDDYAAVKSAAMGAAQADDLGALAFLDGIDGLETDAIALPEIAAATNAAIKTARNYTDAATNAAIETARNYTDAATNALGGAIAALPGADYSTNNAALVETIAAVAPKADVDGKQDKLPYPTNAIPYAAIAGMSEEWVAVSSAVWIDCTGRLARVEAAFSGSGQRLKVVFSRQSGAGGTDELYWREYGGADFNGRIYWDEDGVYEFDPGDAIDPPTRSKYAFLGYFQSSNSGSTMYFDPSGELYQSGGDEPDLIARLRTATTNVTAYAKWGSTYTITLDPNYTGSDPDETIKIYYCSANGTWYDSEECNFTLDADDVFASWQSPMREGFDFDGYWSSASAGSQRITPDGKILYSPSTTTTLYAHWIAAEE